MTSLMQYFVAAWVMVTTPRRLWWRYSYRDIVEFMRDHELSGLDEFRRYDFYFNCFADSYKDITGVRNRSVDPEIHSVEYMRQELKDAEMFHAYETE